MTTLEYPPEFMFKLKGRKLTQEEVYEIADFFRLLNVCGECGKWCPIFYTHMGICMKSYLDPETKFAEKRSAWQLGCESFVFWQEYLWHVPTQKQSKLIYMKKVEMFKEWRRIAEEQILPFFEYSEDIAWGMVFATILSEVENEDYVKNK